MQKYKYYCFKRWNCVFFFRIYYNNWIPYPRKSVRILTRYAVLCQIPFISAMRNKTLPDALMHLH